VHAITGTGRRGLIMSAIDDKYDSLGGSSGFLGDPVGPEPTPNQDGSFRFYAGGAIYWSPATEAHEVHGKILQKWGQLGFERSPHGFPVTDESDSTIAPGKYNLFQDGRILYKFGTDEAFSVHGAIDFEYSRLGFEGGLLGFPVTDENPAGGGGRFNHFENGSIYWKATVGAHEIHGLIRDFWLSAGAENSQFGYPISSERQRPQLAPGGDRFSDFENGVIFWDFGSPNARELISIGDVVAAQAFIQLDQVIRPLILAVDSRLYLATHHPGFPERLIGVTDYSVGEFGAVHNRQFQLQYDLNIHVTDLPDPSVTLDLTVELEDFNDGQSHVVGILRGWHVDVSVPFPTKLVVKPSDIVDSFTAALNPMVGQTHVVQDIPGTLELLSLKTMANGDVRPFLA
jgi:hypothetical protein